VEIVRTSRDPDELRHVWVEWRKESGEKFRGMFEHYVALSNEAATLNSEYRSAHLRSIELKSFLKSRGGGVPLIKKPKNDGTSSAQSNCGNFL
jgi:hypothetical protein